MINLAALLNALWFKGVIGEAMVNLAARLFLDKNEYHLIKSVSIAGEGSFKQLNNSCLAPT